MWQRVAEDYAAFDVDVTTQDPGAPAIDRTNAGDQAYGTRALISADTTVAAADLRPQLWRRRLHRRLRRDRGRPRLPPAGLRLPAHARQQRHQGHRRGGQPRGGPQLRPQPRRDHGVHPGRAAHASATTAATPCGRRSWASATRSRSSSGARASTPTPTTPQDDLAVIAAAAPRDRRRGRRHGRDRRGRDPGPAVHHLGRRHRHLRARDVCRNTDGQRATPARAPPSPDLDIQLELLDRRAAVIGTANPASAIVNRETASGLNASITRRRRRQLLRPGRRRRQRHRNRLHRLRQHRCLHADGQRWRLHRPGRRHRGPAERRGHRRPASADRCGQLGHAGQHRWRRRDELQRLRRRCAAAPRPRLRARP